MSRRFIPILLVVLLLLQVPLALLAHAARGVQAVAGAPAPPPTWGWGYNEYGQVGDGEIAIKTPLPRRVVALDGVTTIAGGGAHSLALRADGTVWNWGSTDHGRIGNGQTKPDSQTTPIQVPGLNAVTAIADGGGHSLVLQRDGTVWGWGSDLDGELGPASTTLDNPTPLRVQGIDQVRAIGAGSRYSLAVRSDGTVWAWGNNEHGQLGVPTADAQSIRINRVDPGRVPGPVDIVAVAAGFDVSLALGSDGTVWSWGGAGVTEANASPGQQVAGLGGITAIAVAYPGLLALKSDGTVWSWRGGVAPAPLAGLTDVRAIAGQGRHSLFLRNDGTILALGAENSSGQLGDGTYEAHPDNPVLVRGIGVATAIGAGGGHSLAVAAPPPPLAPALLRFASQPVGTGGPTLAAVVTNGDSVALAVGGVTTTGDFAPVNDCPASLAPGATCNVRVGFLPTTTGTRSGTLTVVVGGTSRSVALEGSGTPAPTLPVSVAPWYGTAPLGSPREGHTATLLRDGRVLVAGGAIYDAATDRYAPLSSAELYDPATGRWSATGAMRDARQRHTATLLPDGRVLVIGGSSGSTLYAGLLQSVELYDPVTGRWTVVGALPSYVGLTRHTATLLPDGRVMVAGGYSGNGPTVALWIYTPTTDRWQSPIRTMKYYRFDHTATLLPDGTVLFFGGDTGRGNPERFDPVNETRWEIVYNYSTRDGHTATPLSGDVVLLAGGTGRTGYGPPPDFTLYPSQAGGPMNAARRHYTVTLLTDGIVLVAGGDDVAQRPQASTEIYDPAAGSWRVADAMGAARTYQTATRLTNGRVLITGGRSDAGTTVAVELYGTGGGSGGSATPTVTPVATATPTLTPSATPSATLTPTVTPTSTATAVPTVTATPSTTPSATSTVVATATASPTPSVVPTSVPLVPPTPAPSPNPGAAPVVLAIGAAPGGAVTTAPAGPYVSGQPVTLTAHPAVDQLFLGWQIGGVPVGQEQDISPLTNWANPLTITLTADLTVTPRFAQRLRFTDVSPSTTGATEAIVQLAVRGIIRGYADGRFGPNDSTLRAQMAALIVRAMGWGGESANNPFADRRGVDDELWRAIAVLVAHDVVHGYGDGTYGTTDTVLNVQVISFVTRAMVARGYWTQQADDPQLYPNVTDPTHRRDLATYVHYAGVVRGTTAVTAPFTGWDQPASRAWFAFVLWQALDSHFGH